MHHIFKRNLPSVLLLKAETAELGLSMARASLPDLIILDIGLPGLNGFEAFEILQQDEATSHIPVLGTSAFARNSDIEKALNKGFAAYITKPFQVKTLTESVERLLDDGL
ncbi:Polar-differentiation response regulator DivK [compost metagenome]